MTEFAALRLTNISTSMALQFCECIRDAAHHAWMQSIGVSSFCIVQRSMSDRTARNRAAGVYTSGLAFEGVFKLQALLKADEPIYIPSASPSWTSLCSAMGSTNVGGIVLLNATARSTVAPM